MKARILACALVLAIGASATAGCSLLIGVSGDPVVIDGEGGSDAALAGETDTGAAE